jgi:hypothetical protein
MAETIKTVSELKVGDGWRYRCLTCNFEVGIDKAFPETCPGCHAAGWWGRLTAGDSMKNSKAAMQTRDLILSQQENAVVHGLAQNNGVSEPSQGRGRPRQAVPDGLIIKLAGQGFSSRAMVDELDKRGYKNIGYKTVQRRLQASLL